MFCFYWFLIVFLSIHFWIRCYLFLRFFCSLFFRLLFFQPSFVFAWHEVLCENLFLKNALTIYQWKYVKINWFFSACLPSIMDWDNFLKCDKSKKKQCCFEMPVHQQSNYFHVMILKIEFKSWLDWNGFTLTLTRIRGEWLSLVCLSLYCVKKKCFITVSSGDWLATTAFLTLYCHFFFHYETWSKFITLVHSNDH